MGVGEGKTVLVTGGSGYIGGWCIIQLLQQGYRVRTTVRDLKREGAVRQTLSAQVDPGDKLTFFAANLTSDDGWDAAMAGCDYLLHVASPLGVAEPKDPNVLIVPARDGAKRAVAAAIKAGVKRVVMTSSVAAATHGPTAPDSITDESVWTDVKGPKINAYYQSKTIAEKAAWDLIAASDGATTLATVNPALVLGPVLSPDYSESVQIVERLLAGRVPGVPRLGFNVVDVRDVADLHLRAMTSPEAAGQRHAHLRLIAGREQIDDPIDGLGRARRVHRAEHEVAGLRRGHRHRDRFRIAHFADEDHVGVFAHRRAHTLGERGQVRVELALDDLAFLAAMHKLDRVLKADDVQRAGRVQVVDHGGERGGLA